MPPTLIDLDSDVDEPETALGIPHQHTQQFLIPVIQRTTSKPTPARQYADGPLPLRPSDHAPRNARITGRVADDDGVLYTLMVGQLEINEVSVTEILDFVSAYDLEDYENSQFIEEEENRKIAKAAEEAEREAKRQRHMERMRNKGIIFFEDRNEDSESNEEGETVLGRHGRARPTYTHLYKLPGGGEDGIKRRRRKRNPKTGELIPFSDEENSHTMESSDEEMELRREFGRSNVSQPSPFTSGLGPPKRRRRKRHPETGELMPLSGDENAGNSEGGMIVQRPERSSFQSMGPSVRSASVMEPPPRSGPVRANEQSLISDSMSSTQPPVVFSPVRRVPSTIAVELPKRRRRRRDPITGELLPLNPDPHQITAMNTTSLSSATEERKKRPRRRRHPITGELMPLGWVYNPNVQVAPYQVTADVPSMQSLSITRDSKRVKLNFGPSSQDGPPPQPPPPIGSTSVASPQVRSTQVIELSDSESEEQDLRSSIQFSIENAPLKAITQVRSPLKHGMMQRARSYSSSEEPITLESFLSTTASGRVDKTDDDEETSEDSDSEVVAHDQIAPQKTSIMNPMASQEEPANDDDDNDEAEEEEGGDDDELDEGEFFIEGIHAHHMSDPQSHPGLPQVMLYQTKWEGWSEMTWEPAASFPDQRVLEDYRRRVGLKGRG